MLLVKSDFKHLSRQLSFYQMPPSKRRMILKALAQEVAKRSKKRITNQTDLDGKRFEKRKDGTRKKMLNKAVKKGMKASSNQDQGIVSYRNHKVGRIARFHQEGATERLSSTQMRKRASKRDPHPNYDKPATKKQASRLVKLGFKRFINGKWRKERSRRWIREHLTFGQAGLIINELDPSKNRNAYEIYYAARSFLGATEADREHLMSILITKIENYYARK